MNTILLLEKVRKELALARAKAAQHEKTARLAWQTARAAKLKLKQVKKLAKLAKKSARKAEDESELSLEISERLQTKLEKLEKRARKKQPNGKKISPPPAAAIHKKTAVSRPRPKTGSRLKIATPRLKTAQHATPEPMDDGSDAFQQLPPIHPSTSS